MRKKYKNKYKVNKLFLYISLILRLNNLKIHKFITNFNYILFF